MTKQVDHQYYEWLISQIDVPNKGKTYLELFERLHNREFVWTVPNDDNRIGDALQLRHEFFDGFYRHKYKHGDLALDWASILEVLIALSQRTAWVAGGENPTRWAWTLIKNLNLHKLYDPLTNTKADRVDEILEDLIWRTYEPNGRGGFFPLKHDQVDQTKVEIWMQMNTYMIERTHGRQF